MTGVSENIKRAKVKDELSRRIAGGEFAFGSRFPGLHELGAEYGVSYVTISKAVKMLADEGYLRRRPGVGYFVCFAGADARAKKAVNIISTPGYYRLYQADFDFGIGQFRKFGWEVDLLLGDDLYEFMDQLNSPQAYSIITAFNVNWERFSANFGHLIKRTLVLGRLSGNPEITSIICDECESIRLCMEHFAAIGRKRIALVTALPQSELGSLRIAAWRNMMLSRGMKMEWLRRNLIVADWRNQPDDPERITEIYRQWLKENCGEVDGVIVPDSPELISSVCSEIGTKIPVDMDVISIGRVLEKQSDFKYLDNNYREHFQLALKILEERFSSGRTVPGSWYFCPPKGIVVPPTEKKLELLAENVDRADESAEVS